MNSFFLNYISMFFSWTRIKVWIILGISKNNKTEYFEKRTTINPSKPYKSEWTNILDHSHTKITKQPMSKSIDQ